MSPWNNDTPLRERIAELQTHKPFVTKVFTDGMIDLELLADNQTEFVWLYRRNRVEHFLSQTICIITDVHNINKDDTYTTPTDIVLTDIDANNYKNIVKCERLAYNKYKRLFTHEVAYEDLFTNNPWNFEHLDGNSVKLNHYTPELLEQAKTKLEERDLLWQT